MTHATGVLAMDHANIRTAGRKSTGPKWSCCENSRRSARQPRWPISSIASKSRHPSTGPGSDRSSRLGLASISSIFCEDTTAVV